MPYLIHNKKRIIHCLWPTPLAENVRNNLKKGNLIYYNQVVNWQYIVEFCTMNKAMSVRMAPKLNDKRIYLSSFTKTRANLAAQVFSHSNAAGKCIYCIELLSPDAPVTAEFLETFDQFFKLI